MEQNLHRRKSSREEDDVGAPPPPRGRVQSTPIHYHNHSGIPSSPSIPAQSPTLPPSAGPYRTSLMSISTPTVSPLVPTFPISTSQSTPDASSPTHLQPPLSPKQSLAHTRRHSRLHSRNLSDGDAQEIEVRVNHDEENHIPIPSARPHTPLGANFTFGARPPGHHHKHSMSHNFFSFLEPGGPHGRDDHDPASLPATHGSRYPRKCDIQFVLGSWLWVSGQQNGSLSCTGLGYWVVFDAFGIWSARVETVMMFAQVVYLMFSSVYICKETVEHLLLSAGHDGDGHHHHHGRPLDADLGEVSGIDFPIILVCLTLVTLLVSALKFGNHEKLVTVTETQVPPLRSLLRSRKQHQHSDPPPTTSLGKVVRNPFVVIPIGISLSILGVWIGILGSCSPNSPHLDNHDLILAALITIATSNVAYRACIRGLAGGKMEPSSGNAHPQILHLPAPHIWQLTPSPGTSEDLVVTLELHVKDDLCDDDVLKLTRWAWERCVGALEGPASKTGSGAASVCPQSYRKMTSRGQLYVQAIVPTVQRVPVYNYTWRDQDH
ncbi:hypothetical protein BD779DRAFT_1612849 [Infundibulicybe gibba]|nr:hypothetical protein BD779DRAFT_1612849 [Infundibulicybe gibba]